MHAKSIFCRIRLFVTPWTVAHQAPLSMGLCRQECWSGLPCPPPGEIPNPGTKPRSLLSPELGGGFFTTTPPGKPHSTTYPLITVGITFFLKLAMIQQLYLFRLSFLYINQKLLLTSSLSTNIN